MKSDVTPLPYRSSPTATGSFSPFLGYFCCGPSFCDQQQAATDLNIQPWCASNNATPSGVVNGGGGDGEQRSSSPNENNNKSLVDSYTDNDHQIKNSNSNNIGSNDNNAVMTTEE